MKDGLQTRDAHPAWLGLGGNIGDVRAALALALQGFDAHEHVRIEAVSPLYETPPWGLEDQPRFLNCCAAITTTLSPDDLLALCHRLEREGHRERTVRWGPRTLDIDIIAYEGETRTTQTLTLPHPRAGERAFVVLPLETIAPTLEVNGQQIAALAGQVSSEGITRMTTDGDWWRSGL
ncbi:MAG: 2-amino-4-hydroxy-6-hydroxymethyldihydropteridine diphosphokinase [Pseudomonadota bacterium]